MFTQSRRRRRRFPASAALDAVVDAAVREGLIPGAVLIVGHDGKIVHRKAYGSRALVPSREAMTLDTIFDMASLTKVTATTPVADEAVRARQAAHRRSRYRISAGVSGGT